MIFEFWIKMPLVKVCTNLSKGQVPNQFMPQLIDEFSQIICKDKTLFDWILDSDVCMSNVSNLHCEWILNRLKYQTSNYVLPFQGPNSEGTPYIWIEIRAMNVFDSQDNCESLCPKLFEAVMRLIGLSKEQIHILIGPVEPFQMGHNGEMLGWYSCVPQSCK